MIMCSCMFMGYHKFIPPWGHDCHAGGHACVSKARDRAQDRSPFSVQCFCELKTALRVNDEDLNAN